MEISSSKAREYTGRIMRARMSLMSRNGFYGLLLMHVKFALNESVRTAATDGERMFFAPSFLDDISDRELVFIMQHEILHIVLRHCFRTGDRNDFLFNIACDIVVNSTIMMSAGGNPASITLSKYGESMHITPKGDEGSNYTAEEVYEMLKTGGSSAKKYGQITDNHSAWGTSRAEGLEDEWRLRIKDAYEASKKRSGKLPAGLERAIGELTEPQTDWRTILNDFVQEEIADYSFSPPDRRFGESPFFLPDFSEKIEVVRNVLFMIDTSGSMTKEEITEVYSEVKGAVDQFGGALEGLLGFFDEEVVPPKSFTDTGELLEIIPSGGGGTSFDVIFEYIRKEMADMDIASIIIMTDGYASFPEESAAMGIPVMWMINNDTINPPWGRVIRLNR